MEFDVKEIPELPNLRTLTIYRCDNLLQMDRLHVKCPILQQLIIVNEFTDDLNGIQGLQIDELVIDCEYLINVNYLHQVKVNRLIFSKNCTSITPRMVDQLTHIKDVRFEQ
jgi:hypothetical protein